MGLGAQGHLKWALEAAGGGKQTKAGAKARRLESWRPLGEWVEGVNGYEVRKSGEVCQGQIIKGLNPDHLS